MFGLFMTLGVFTLMNALLANMAGHLTRSLPPRENPQMPHIGFLILSGSGFAIELNLLAFALLLSSGEIGVLVFGILFGALVPNPAVWNALILATCTLLGFALAWNIARHAQTSVLPVPAAP